MTHPAAIFIRQWWAPLMLIGALLVATVEARYQINQLMKDKTINDRQWLVIRASATNVTLLADKHILIDQVITPESMQKWGAVKDAVDRHEQDIYDLQQANRTR